MNHNINFGKKEILKFKSYLSKVLEDKENAFKYCQDCFKIKCNCKND